MKTIEDEALGYVISNGGNKPETFTDEQIGRLHGYIDGANSKWVKAEKIKVQIELLDKVIKSELSKETITTVLINGLKQQLKELGNE